MVFAVAFCSSLSTYRKIFVQYEPGDFFKDNFFQTDRNVSPGSLVPEVLSNTLKLSV